ncbi:MAG: GNAT family N-acetyltransferase [Oscillospiraceae bacterium]|nr:GNAT family N-acetyltransferase [Oscillospiraceae bacterium]
MADIQIRQAGIEDLDLLMQWRMETLRNVFPPDLGPYPADLEEQNRDYYEKELPAGGHIACFALLDDEIVGCGGLCLTREMPSPDNPTGACAYLMNIYTRAPFRGRGVGEAVVRWLIARAEERQVPKIYLETSDEGRRLYEKLGFADLPDMMKLRQI